MQNQLTEAARKLSIPERITLVEEIGDAIAEENRAFELTDVQKRNSIAVWNRREQTLVRDGLGKRQKLNS